MSRGQAERLFPLLEELLDEAQLTWQSLDAIGVGIGPGNFTGIRIAVSAARGLALASGIPAIGVSGFQIAAALASGSRQRHAFTGITRLPGPRGTAFQQRFSSGAPAGPASVAEDGAPEPVALNWSADALPLLATIAADAVRSGAEIPRPAPMYIRPADAAPSREAGPVILP